ncbi:hypothetical protein Droror1_Dr00005659 [Drosera rotundifolia]
MELPEHAMSSLPRADREPQLPSFSDPRFSQTPLHSLRTLTPSRSLHKNLESHPQMNQSLKLDSHTILYSDEWVIGDGVQGLEQGGLIR